MGSFANKRKNVTNNYNLVNNFNRIQNYNWAKEIVGLEREYLQKLDHDGRKFMVQAFIQMGFDYSGENFIKWIYKSDEIPTPKALSLAIGKWRELLKINRSVAKNNSSKQGVLKGRKQDAILAAIVYNCIIVHTDVTLSHKQFLSKLQVHLKPKQFTDALGIVHKFIPFQFQKNNTVSSIQTTFIKVLNSLNDISANMNKNSSKSQRYSQLYNMFRQNLPALMKNYNSIVKSDICKSMKPKEIVASIFKDFGVDKNDLVTILNLTEVEKQRMILCSELRAKENTSSHKSQSTYNHGEFKRVKDYRITLRRINVGPVETYKTKIQQKISAAKLKKKDPLKLVDIKSLLMNIIKDRGVGKINFDILKSSTSKNDQKLVSSIEYYINETKQFGSYNELLESLLVLQKVNLSVLFNTFELSPEFWSISFAGEKDGENNTQFKMKNKTKTLKGMEQKVKQKKEDDDKVYKTFQNAAEIRMNFKNSDYIVRLFANGKCSVTIGGDKSEGFADSLIEQFRHKINSQISAIEQSERSIYFNKTIKLTKNEMEKQITNAMINANIKTNAKYITSPENTKGSINLYNILSQYKSDFVPITHIGLKAKQPQLSISKNQSKVILKLKGTPIKYSSDDNGGVKILPSIISIQFNVKGTIEITARTYKDLDIASTFINKVFKKHSKELLVKTKVNKPTSKSSNKSPIKPTSKSSSKTPNKTPNNSKSSNNSVTSTNSIFNNIGNNFNDNLNNMRLNNFNVINVKNDGHCMFRAIAVGLQSSRNGPQLSSDEELKIARKLRKKVSKIICSNNGNDLVPHMDGMTYKEWVLTEINQSSRGKKLSDDELFDRYCKNLKSSNLWGGALEMTVISHELKVPIILFEEYEIILKIGMDEYSDRSRIYLQRVNNDHFKTLIPYDR